MIKPFYAIGIFLYHLKTYFMALLSFYTPEISENQNFLRFSGSIEKNQWHETGLMEIPRYVKAFPLHYTDAVSKILVF